MTSSDSNFWPRAPATAAANQHTAALEEHDSPPQAGQ
jgi:hypothetical protein